MTASVRGVKPRVRRESTPVLVSLIAGPLVVLAGAAMPLVHVRLGLDLVGVHSDSGKVFLVAAVLVALIAAAAIDGSLPFMTGVAVVGLAALSLTGYLVYFVATFKDHYPNDSRGFEEFQAAFDTSPGYGIYVMLAGGVLALAGAGRALTRRA